MLRTLQSTIVQYTFFFPSACGTFTTLDLIGHKANFFKLKKNLIIQRMLLNHNKIKPQINDKNISGKASNILK